MVTQVSSDAFDGKVKGYDATFPEILQHAGSYVQAVQATVRLMFRRHEHCEFRRKQRVTDSRVIVAPRWQRVVNHLFRAVTGILGWKLRPK